MIIQSVIGIAVLIIILPVLLQVLGLFGMAAIATPVLIAKGVVAGIDGVIEAGLGKSPIIPLESTPKPLERKYADLTQAEKYEYNHEECRILGAYYREQAQRGNK